MTSQPSMAELIVCVVARELRDEQIVAFGLHAELMLVAALLAQRLHAPELVIRHGRRAERGVEIGPASWPDGPRSHSHEQIEYLECHDAILGVANPGSALRFCDVFFVGGLQIDAEGSTNLIGIKSKNGRPAVRGPGSIGTSSIGTLAESVILFSWEHSPRRFVERVDYVSVPGWKRREAAGLPGGPALCISALGVMEFVDSRMGLRSVHPGVTEAEVRSATGFTLASLGNVATTPPPTREELSALRCIDPDSRLARYLPTSQRVA